MTKKKGYFSPPPKLSFQQRFTTLFLRTLFLRSRGETSRRRRHHGGAAADDDADFDDESSTLYYRRRSARKARGTRLEDDDDDDEEEEERDFAMSSHHRMPLHIDEREVEEKKSCRRFLRDGGIFERKREFVVFFFFVFFVFVVDVAG